MSMIQYDPCWGHFYEPTRSNRRLPRQKASIEATRVCRANWIHVIHMGQPWGGSGPFELCRWHCSSNKSCGSNPCCFSWQKTGKTIWIYFSMFQYYRFWISSKICCSPEYLSPRAFALVQPIKQFGVVCIVYQYHAPQRFGTLASFCSVSRHLEVVTRQLELVARSRDVVIEWPDCVCGVGKMGCGGCGWGWGNKLMLHCKIFSCNCTQLDATLQDLLLHLRLEKTSRAEALPQNHDEILTFVAKAPDARGDRASKRCC